MIDSACSLSKRYRYSDYIELFLESVDKVDDLKYCWEFGGLWRKQYRPGVLHDFDAIVRLFNTLILAIRSNYEDHYKQRITGRRYYLAKRHKAVGKWIDRIFEKCHRVAVIRLDFGYSKEFVMDKNPETIGKHLDKLRNNYRHCHLFDGLITDFFVIEHGVDRGVHSHAVFFFNGSVRDPRKHVKLAKDIGDYWSRVITKGQGSYFNCNAVADAYPRRGIGEVAYYNSELILNLKEVVFGYFFKEDQIIEARDGERFRRYRAGQVSSPVSRRPRNKFLDTLQENA